MGSRTRRPGTEHKYVGVNCGIMDQFASVFGKEGKLMRSIATAANLNTSIRG